MESRRGAAGSGANGDVEIAVSDNGPGIPDAEKSARDRAFLPGRFQPGTARRGPGAFRRIVDRRRCMAAISLQFSDNTSRLDREHCGYRLPFKAISREPECEFRTSLKATAGVSLHVVRPYPIRCAGPARAGRPCRTADLARCDRQSCWPIVVPVILATLAFAWWFRAGNSKAKYRPNWAYSGRLEAIVWSIPALDRAVPRRHRLGRARTTSTPAKPSHPHTAPIEVQVVSLDWKWLFIYPDQGIASVNRLVVPGGHADPFPADLGHR